MKIQKIELARLYTGVKRAMLREDGQDLTQMGLIVALVAVGATAGMNSVATAVGTAFGSLGTFVSNLGGLMIH
jgi:Flp pilus assembly pilin Flp